MDPEPEQSENDSSTTFESTDEESDDATSPANDSLTEEQRQFLWDCENLFVDRYTEKDSDFMILKNRDLEPPPILFPYHPGKDNRRGRGRGGYDRGRRGRDGGGSERSYNKAGPSHDSSNGEHHRHQNRGGSNQRERYHHSRGGGNEHRGHQQRYAPY